MSLPPLGIFHIKNYLCPGRNVAPDGITLTLVKMEAFQSKDRGFKEKGRAISLVVKK